MWMLWKSPLSCDLLGFWAKDNMWKRRFSLHRHVDDPVLWEEFGFERVDSCLNILHTLHIFRETCAKGVPLLTIRQNLSTSSTACGQFACGWAKRRFYRAFGDSCETHPPLVHKNEYAMHAFVWECIRMHKVIGTANERRNSCKPCIFPK